MTAAHIVPKWYQALVPTSGGRVTPNWTVASHFDFMASQGIDRAVLTFSAPGPNVFLGPANKARTIALSRLIDEHTAAYCRARPTKLRFYARVPLPYTNKAVVEARYAVEVLGSVGVLLQSSVEGKYLGDPDFEPLFASVNG